MKDRQKREGRIMEDETGEWGENEGGNVEEEGVKGKESEDIRWLDMEREEDEMEDRERGMRKEKEREYGSVMGS